VVVTCGDLMFNLASNNFSVHTAHWPYNTPLTALHPTTRTFSSQNPLLTQTSLQNLPAHNKNAQVQSREAATRQFGGTSALQAGNTMSTSKARPKGCDMKNLSMEGSGNVRGTSVSSMSMRYIRRTCNNAERPNIAIERVTR